MQIFKKMIIIKYPFSIHIYLCILQYENVYVCSIYYDRINKYFILFFLMYTVEIY